MFNPEGKSVQVLLFLGILDECILRLNLFRILQWLNINLSRPWISFTLEILLFRLLFQSIGFLAVSTEIWEADSMVLVIHLFRHVLRILLMRFKF